MSEQSSQEEDIQQRLKKKIKRDEVMVNLVPNTDITQLAIQRFAEVKKQYNFVSFEEADKSKSVLCGKVEVHTLPIYDFNEEMHKFRNLGYCANPDPETKGLVFGTKIKELKERSQLEGEVIDFNHTEFKKKLYDSSSTKGKKEKNQFWKQRRDKSDNVLDYQGPWAGYGENLYNGALTAEQKQQLSKAQQTKQIRIEQARIQEKNFEPYSIFHWKDYHDYKGQSYVEPPPDLKKNSGPCYLPKKQIFSWVGSQRQGYQAVRFFPNTGHFFLLGNAEGKVQLFDLIKNKSCAHTYLGHTKPIRDIQFTNDGKHFLSAGFDGQVHYWDTEYGKVLRTFKLKKLPFCVRFHPSNNYQHVFLCGSSSRKIYQFDLNTGGKTQEYNQHLGTVNTLTFIEQNKFVSSSDDKKLFIWEYGIPVVTRHVSEPQMHTITSTAMHPSGQYFAGQSSDNQIVIYENKGGNFRRLRSKKFASHFCAGYACSIDFSPDGQFLLTGDERGKLFFYDWKTSKSYRVLDGHGGTSIGLEWHPSHPTRVLSVGWEGMVKLWE